MFQRTEMSWVRTQLGVCPQHDILFPALSAYEHLWLCASLRGVSREEIDRDAGRFWFRCDCKPFSSFCHFFAFFLCFAAFGRTIERLFSSVGLKPSDLLKPASSMSGGQKRKLAVAIAFIGNTKLVLLDEPVSDEKKCCFFSFSLLFFLRV